ncbi:hypothetical protein GCM10007853_23660 [Algimonas ampicilliniresistens]|uniref:WYL domain-containing protein n=1 Tax=Algimonas ampicilliniresistens TaxID=1298735 RepID=A0ABQ5VBN4_9PROT|nr:hypothetical protein GCM10007853_23660 [Algimonas ampicilliniresistens]
MNQTIISAIQNREILEFHYKGRMRRVEPHMYGIDTKGHPSLNAWQLSGGSGQDFRNFHLDILSMLCKSGQTFSGPRPGYNPNDPAVPQVFARL